jgi:hypothetical protein
VTRTLSKLVAIVLVAIVVAAGAGYWLLSPKPTSEIVNYTSEETSLEVSRTTLGETLTTSTSSTTSTSASETTLWINITSTKPVSYYISLLKSAGSQPYVELGWDLQTLPDATNATAVAKITYLALNATDPEVKEAFQLVMKGGTPDPRDFRYSVPTYNTELQVLYWLALQNQFKKDDTLALAIAMVNGLWVTMGDDQVIQAIYNDANGMLNLGRETSQWQKSLGLPYNLEDYPLEAKCSWAWRGNDTPSHGPYALGGQEYALRNYKLWKLDLKGYQWDTVSIDTLRTMRNLMSEKKWINGDINTLVENLEKHFWFSRNAWVSPSSTDTVVIDNESYHPKNLNNADFEFQYFAKNGSGIGVCEDAMTLLDALCKSCGIATIPKMAYWNVNRPNDQRLYGGHTHILYFDASKRVWTGYAEELLMGERNGVADENTPVDVYVLRLPIFQQKYLGKRSDSQIPVTPSAWKWSEVNNAYFAIYDTTLRKTCDLFSEGVPSLQMKQWLLYS